MVCHNMIKTLPIQYQCVSEDNVWVAQYKKIRSHNYLKKWRQNQ